MSTLTFGDSSTESLYDFSDELNESVHYHNFFNKEQLEEDLTIHSSNGKLYRPRTFNREGEEDVQE
jgi:hypothetical protein